MSNAVAPARPVVLTIHGIRTRGAWQKDITPILDNAGFHHIPLDFDFFRALKLLWPSSRRKQIDWLRDQYDRNIQPGTPPPSVIAHSFGTYLVARLIEIYGYRFDKMILCGSIVRRDYPWPHYAGQVKFQTVLNEFGKKDFPARIAEWAINDAGSSGTDGFTEHCTSLTQLGHAEHRHSDYFYDGNYRETWIPFLEGKVVQQLVAAPRKRVNWRNRLLMLTIFLIAGLILAYASWWAFIRKPTHKHNPITFVQFLSDFKLAVNDGPRMAALQKHKDEHVEWNGYIAGVQPNEDHPAYSVGANADSKNFEDWFLVEVDRKTDDLSLPIGTPVRVEGVIQRVTPTGPILHKASVTRQDKK